MSSAFADTDRLAEVALDSAGLPARTPEQQQEIDVALFDLSESNRLRPTPREPAPPGPYRLTIGIVERRLAFQLATADGAPVGGFHLSLAPLREAVADYHAICDSYADAVRTQPPEKIEAIDIGRRALHDAGAEALRERLAGKAETDTETARRLFTLVAALMRRP